MISYNDAGNPFNWQRIFIQVVRHVGWKCCYAMSIAAAIWLPFYFISSVVMGGTGSTISLF